MTAQQQRLLGPAARAPWPPVRGTHPFSFPRAPQGLGIVQSFAETDSGTGTDEDRLIRGSGSATPGWAPSGTASGGKLPDIEIPPGG